MAFASITYTSASGTTFALTNSDGNAIEYLRQADISVTVNGTLQTLTTDYTFNAAGTSIVLNTAVTNATVVLARTTSIVDATVSFTAGSTLTAQDLNNSDRQNRFALQEFSDIYDGLRTGDEDLSALGGFIGSSEAWLSDDEHAATTGAIDARIDSKVDSGLTGDISGGDGVTIVGDTPAAGQIRIDLDADIATLRNMQTGAASQLAALTSDELAILDGATVTTAELNFSDGVTSNIQTQLDNKQGLDAELTELATMASDTASALADLTQAEVQILDGATVTTDELNILDGVTATGAELNFVDGVTSNIQTQLDNKQPLDAELTELATMGANTASALADLTQAEVQILDGATLSTAELNQLDGNSLTTTFNSSATDEFPSSSAINTHVVGLMDSLGGFVAIPDDQSFPTTNPDPSDNAGTVVSIADAGGVVINASGESTTGRTTGSDVVTITGFPASLQSTTIQAGLGLQVQTTTTLNTYTYHKLIAREDDIIQLSDDINDFNNRYRPARATDYTTDNDEGDMYFNTTDNRLRVFDGSAYVTGVASSAAEVTNVAAGDIVATNVQDAIDELDDEKVPRTGTTGSALIPAGTTGERDASPSNGMFRYNTSNNQFEGRINGAWGSIGGGATGGGSDAVFIENGQNVTQDYSIPANTNAGSFGPITIDSGVTVTVPATSNWTIV